MAEGFTFEHYHIPQQSRREKLRVLATQNNQIPGFVEPSSSSSSHNTLHPGINIAALPSLYDPLIPSDFGGSVKEEGSNLMIRFTTGVGGVVNGSSCSNSSSSSSVSHHHHHHANYLDPESSLHINPAIQVINSNNPFLYQPQSLQNLRDQFNHSYNDGSDDQVMVFKPEPLSLSLSSHNNNNNNNNTQHNQANHHLHQRYGSVIYGGGSEVVTTRNYSVPLGPFTGYASVLKGSRFLKPAQQLLEEICDVGVRAAGVCAVSEKITADASLMMETTPHEESLLGVDDDSLVGDHGSEGSRKNKSRLLTMLDEVYRRYRQYYQQIHAVVTSFEYVAGLGNAAPYASLAINAMSKHFRCLKNVITDQLQSISKSHNFQISNNRKDESPRFRSSDGVGPYGQRPGFLDHQQPVWRPQRGLPEHAVSVLRAWLFEHFLHPYPTDSDKLMLAKQTGLSRNQVSNWFINARVRLWKPMVEEIHMLESQQAQKKSQRGEELSRNNNNLSDHRHLPSSDNNNNNNIVTENNPSTTSMDKFQDVPYKRTRNELVPNHVPVMRSHHHEQQLNQPNTTSSNHHQQVAAASVGGGVSMHHGNNGVSLTLGLHHQNHGIAGLSDHQPFSNMSAAQRFSLALQPDHHGYVSSGGFDSQNRQQFGRDHVIGGQLLHDFVG